MSKSGQYASIFVLIQVIAFLIYVARGLDEYNNNLIGPTFLRDYYTWSIAGASVMLAGLVMNIINYLSDRQKVVLQLGTILIIAGMIVLTVGQIIRMNHLSGYDAAVSQWIMMLAGGGLVIYENYSVLA